MRIYRCIVLLFFLTFAVFAQTGTTSGFVFDESNGESLIGANIYCKGTNFGAVTNHSGYYVISGLPPGSYRLIASYIGFKYHRQLIEIKDSDDIKIHIQSIPALFETETDVVSADSVRTALKLFRQNVSNMEISPMEIENLPAVVETDLLSTWRETDNHDYYSFISI